MALSVKTELVLIQKGHLKYNGHKGTFIRQSMTFRRLTSSKETQVTRPQSQHRNSMASSASLSTPSRGSASRHHSHSLSLGSINSTHRVTRRKSTNASSINNVSAVKAALKEMSQGGSTSVFDSNIQSHRRSVPDFSSKNSHEGSLAGSVPAQAPTHRDTALHDGSLPTTHQMGHNARPRARRASEGSYLIKGDGKRASGELRCDQCGKGYKHSSCLTKHLLVHLPFLPPHAPSLLLGFQAICDP